MSHRAKPHKIDPPKRRNTDLDDVERTSRDTTFAQWGVASVVMVGSMASGGYSFWHLHPVWWSVVIGIVTALAVDAALAAWLFIDRRLRAVGARAPWGWVLEGTAAAMTMYLNIGAALFKGVSPDAARYLLATAHSFLPVMLVLVSLAGGQAQLKLIRVRQDREAEAKLENNRLMAEERARVEAEEARSIAERNAEQDRQERVLADQRKLAELADLQHQREIADRRETREQNEHELAATLASMLIVNTTLRRRPKPRPRPASQASRPSVPAPVPASVPGERPSPVPVTDDLLSRALRLRTKRESQGESTGRAVLQRELGVPERTARELVRRMDERPVARGTDGGHGWDTGSAAKIESGGTDRKLHALQGGAK